MKKIGTAIVIVFISTLVFEVLGLWQATIIAGIFGGLFVSRSRHAFLIGFCGVALCWLTILVYSELNHEIVPVMNVTSRIMMLPPKFSFLIFIGTLFVGGILGGLGGLNGLWWKRLFDR
jgi:uncharacterized membrane protein YuzA (DUF378 family)